MDLLSASDLDGFSNSMSDIADTFLKDTVDYVKVQDAVHPFGEKAQAERTVYTLRCLNVPESGKSDRLLDLLNIGKADNTESYLLLFFNDVKEAGLTAPDDSLLMEPGKDEINFKGQNLKITGITLIPLLSDRRSFLSINYAQQI